MVASALGIPSLLLFLRAVGRAKWVEGLYIDFPVVIVVPHATVLAALFAEERPP